MPILVIPILAGGLIGVLMIKVLGVPIALFMDHANHALKVDEHRKRCPSRPGSGRHDRF